MSRLISRFEVPSQPNDRPLAGRGGLAGGEGEGGGQKPADTAGAKVYFDLILKMIPAEIVTLYTFVIKLVPLAGGSSLQRNV